MPSAVARGGAAEAEAVLAETVLEAALPEAAAAEAATAALFAFARIALFLGTGTFFFIDTVLADVNGAK